MWDNGLMENLMGLEKFIMLICKSMKVKWLMVFLMVRDVRFSKMVQDIQVFVLFCMFRLIQNGRNYGERKVCLIE